MAILAVESKNGARNSRGSPPSSSVEKMRGLDNLETDQRFAHLTKKERLKLTKDRSRLEKVLEGGNLSIK